MKLILAVMSRSQPSHVTVTGSPNLSLGRFASLNEESHLQVAGGQQREDRLAGRDQFAPAVIDLLDRAGDGAEDFAAGEPRLRRVEPRLRGAQPGLGVVQVFLRPGLRFQQLLRAVVGLLRVLHRGLLQGDVGLLQIGIDREQQHAALDLIAFSHRERLDATGLVGTDENQLGLDPALKGRLFSSIAGGEQEGCKQCERDAAAAHVALLAPNSTSRCAAMSPRTSSGAKRPNRAFHMMATRAGATSNCGKRASASWGSSPRSTANVSRARMTGSTRAMTSR